MAHRTSPVDPEGWRRQLKFHYGITAEEYHLMVEDQDGLCGICQQTNSTGNRLAVDHDHETGAIRGLLCATCNMGLGLLGEDAGNLDRAKTWLSRSVPLGRSIPQTLFPT